MKTFFWICWISELIIACGLLILIMRVNFSGAAAQKDAKEIMAYWMLLLAAIVLLVSSKLLFNNGWFKTAALFSAAPLIILALIMCVPIIAYLSGERMN